MRSSVKKAIAKVLKVEARAVMGKYKPRVIAVTGSVGKTSTKDAIYSALANVVYVRKSQKNYNSEFGLPLTVLGCTNGWNNYFIWAKNILIGLWLVIWPHRYPDWLVLEVGISKPGDMNNTAGWLKTDAVVMTAIGETPVHIEFFESRKHLVEEKSELIRTLKKDGILVLNGDDPTILEMKSLTKCITITYGFSEGVDVRGSGESVFYNEKKEPGGIIYRVDTEGKSLPVVVEGVFGRNHTYATLAALALSYGLKLNMIEAVEALKHYDAPPGRMRLLKGIKETLLIDDTYNSSPLATDAALKSLSDIDGKRKIAVLGDMLELGKHTAEAHKSIGRFANDCADVLVVVGQRAKGIKEGAIEAGMATDKIFEFLDSTAAGEFLRTFVKEGDRVLLKASQGIRMERAVSAILLDQKNKSSLLVRQDPEWLKRK